MWLEPLVVCSSTIQRPEEKLSGGCINPHLRSTAATSLLQ
jgi:hypothetical protein